MEKTSMFSEEEVKLLNKEFEAKPAQDLLQWGFKQFGSQVALACSFGLEDVALIDILTKLGPKPRIFFLDTGRLHQETYDVMERCRTRYEIEFEVFFPKADAVEDLVRSKGPNSFYLSVENRRECCNIRKVEPLSRALGPLKAWITGLRRDQSVTRQEIAKIEIDHAHGGLLKLNPLAEWGEEELWGYIRKNDVPYNALHEQGFPSIGCAPCTRAIKPGEDIRSGRWWWENPLFKECGLHK